MIQKCGEALAWPRPRTTSFAPAAVRLGQNTCTCDGGTVATGASCTSDGAHICASCYAGYSPSGNSCSPRRAMVQAPSGYGKILVFCVCNSVRKEGVTTDLKIADFKTNDRRSKDHSPKDTIRATSSTRVVAVRRLANCGCDSIL